MWLSSFEKLRTLLTDWIVLTCSHLSGDAFLKISKARVELLTDRSHLEVAENLIRGGVSLVFSKRLATINNKYLEGFDETKAGRYGFLVDANNLYGGILQKFPLPLNEFEIVDVELSTILRTANDSGNGFVLEVDLDYPDALHNMHKDFPLAPMKEKLIAICCPSIRWAYWIKHVKDVLPRQSLYRHYSRRKITPFITLP